MTVADRTLAALRAAGPISAAGLADAVYADDPEGGPATAAGIIKIAILRLRERGHEIETTRSGYVYRGVVTGPTSTTNDRRRARTALIADRRRRVQELRRTGCSVATIVWTAGVSESVVYADLRALGMRLPREIRAEQPVSGRILEVLRAAGGPVRVTEVADRVSAADPAGRRTLGDEYVAAQIRQLRRDGHPICLSRSGYVYGGEASP